MDAVAVLAALVVVFAFGAILFFVLRSDRKEADRRRHMAQELGFAPMDPDPDLAAKIGALYPQHSKAEHGYELRHVSRRVTSEGELYIFDLVDVAGEDDSRVQTQAVAVVSARLNLPQFLIYTKPDIEGWASQLAERVIDWAVTGHGTRVEFPDHPEFESRYVVTSSEPEAARRFFEGAVIGGLPHTGPYSVHGRGHMFTFGELATQSGSVNLETLRRRLERARGLERLFQRDWRSF